MDLRARVLSPRRKSIKGTESQLAQSAIARATQGVLEGAIGDCRAHLPSFRRHLRRILLIFNPLHNHFRVWKSCFQFPQALSIDIFIPID